MLSHGQLSLSASVSSSSLNRMKRQGSNGPGIPLCPASRPHKTHNIEISVKVSFILFKSLFRRHSLSFLNREKRKDEEKKKVLSFIVGRFPI